MNKDISAIKPFLRDYIRLQRSLLSRKPGETKLQHQLRIEEADRQSRRILNPSPTASE